MVILNAAKDLVAMTRTFAALRMTVFSYGKRFRISMFLGANQETNLRPAQITRELS